MSALEALFIFVGIPLLLAVAITVMVLAPSLAKSKSPRAGRDWHAEPEWFGAPRAVRAIQAGRNSRQIDTESGDGYDPASAGHHGNTVKDEQALTVARDDQGTRGNRDLPAGTNVPVRTEPVTAGPPDDSSRDQTGGASVRW